MVKFTCKDVEEYAKKKGCIFAKAYSIVEKKAAGLPCDEEEDIEEEE